LNKLLPPIIQLLKVSQQHLNPSGNTSLKSKVLEEVDRPQLIMQAFNPIRNLLIMFRLNRSDLMSCYSTRGTKMYQSKMKRGPLSTGKRDRFSVHKRDSQLRI
jgi:hypothetical protein